MVALIELVLCHRRTFAAVGIDPVCQMRNALRGGITIFKILRIIFVFVRSCRNENMLVDRLVSFEISLVIRLLFIVTHISGIRGPEGRTSDDVVSERLVLISVTVEKCVVRKHTAE